MKKLLLLLLFVPFVYGAQYNYTITTDFVDILETGNKGLGNIIVQPYIANKTQYDINNTVNFEITRSDTIRNLLGYSIQISGDIIVNNEVYAFPGANLYQVKRLNDSVITFDISVVEIPSATFDMFMEHNYFELEDSHAYTISNTDERSFNVTLDYSMFQEPQGYLLPFKFKLNGKEVKEIDYNLNLSELHKFKVTKGTCAVEMPILTSGSLCEFAIENQANALLDIQTSSNKYGKHFYFPETIGVFPGATKTISIFYDLTTDIPKITNDTMNITFRSGGHSVDVPIDVLFTDRVVPGFRNFTMPDIEVLREFSATVDVVDNYNISYAESIVYKSEPSGWAIYEKKDLVHIKFDTYNFSFKPINKGRYKLELRAKDFGENINVTTWEFQVNEMNAFEYSRNIKFGKVKQGKYLSQSFGTLTYPADVEARVKVLNYGLESGCTWGVKLVNTNTGNEQFVRNVNETFRFSEVGNYTLGFTGACLTEGFDGALEFAVPDFHAQINDIVFSGEVVNFTVPGVIINKEWNGGILNCEVQDTGDITTSTYRCIVEYPLTSAEMNLVPVSQDAYESTIEGKDIEIEKWRSKNAGKLWWIWIMIFAMVFIALYASFMMYVHPDLYWKVR